MPFPYLFRLLSVLFAVTSLSVASYTKRNLNDLGAKPVHVHLSYGSTVNDIVVTWVTASSTRKSAVLYGINGLINRAEGKELEFRHSNTRVSYIHTALLPNLEPNTTYEYQCGCEYGWSDVFHFHTPPNGNNWSPSFAIYGDMGYENAQVLPYLIEDVKRGMYDTFFHVGDMAYNFDSNEGRVGDAFMESIEPIAAYTPYMTVVGNHEEYNNFSDYRYRFTMPGDTQGIFYSINIGPVHFVIVSTEVYYFYKYYGTFGIDQQLKWLHKDLQEAAAPENRKLRPWIITMGHRPMYCSTLAHDEECKSVTDVVRVGFPFKNNGLEKIFYKYGVDIEIWGHEHNYERSWPLFDYKIFNGSNKNPFHNPGGPIHVTTGAAGSKEKFDPFEVQLRNWTAFRSDDYSYTRMKVFNATHIFFEQISANKSGNPIDNFWVIKDYNSVYPKRPKLKNYLTNGVFTSFNSIL
ncbi:hypothetical protein RUM43_001174 [Polyplax serrata]|uniref:Purple acid phosphatase n=1 Tax=Polyplax serrata TaxID=468196 RepID=A0AAN8SDE5_POLSC